MSAARGSRNASIVSAILSVVTILTGLFLLLIYQFFFGSFLNELIADVVGTYEFTTFDGPALFNEWFGIITGDVVWIAGAALIAVGLINEFRRRRTIVRQRRGPP